jgi:OmpA-OmpF porin, OOP family
MKLCRLSSVAFAVLLSVPLLASAEERPSWYVGADLGRSSYTLKLPGEYNLSSLNTTNSSYSEKRNSTGVDAFVGYRINTYVAVEAGYVDLGKYTLKINDLNSSDYATGTAKVSGVSLSALWQLPVNEQWTVFARTGLMKANGKVDVDANFTTETYSQNVSGVVPIIGLGIAYAINNQWQVRAQYQDIGSASIAKAAGKTLKIHDDFLSVGLSYGF